MRRRWPRRRSSRLVDDLLGVELLETWEPRDPITYTYVVDTPPAISFAEVLVAE